MIKLLHITSPRIIGHVEILYKSDVLSRIDFTPSNLNATQINAFKSSIPTHFIGLEMFVLEKQVSVTDVEYIITFDNWFDDYDMRVAKDRAMKHWDKMSKQDKIICMESNKAYKRYIKRNASWYKQMYPDKYLFQKHYLSEWDKI